MSSVDEAAWEITKMGLKGELGIDLFCKLCFIYMAGGKNEAPKDWKTAVIAPLYKVRGQIIDRKTI